MGRVAGRVLGVVVVVTTLAACSGGGTDDRDFTEGVGGARETKVQFVGADNVKLAGTFSRPASAKGSMPGVLLVPGTARTDRDGVTDLRRPDTLYRDLSAAFTEAGMATFRYDRRGVGLSRLETDQQRLSYADLVADARAALDFLAQRKETDDAPLAVVGYDTGGLIAMTLAAEEAAVKGLVLLSTPGRKVVDVYAESFARSHGPASAEAFRQEVDTLLATGTLPSRDEVRPEHQGVLPDRQDELLGTLFTLDPVAGAARVTVPTLIVTGSKSTIANSTDAERLAQVLRAPQVVVTDTNGSLQVEGPDIPPPVFDPDDDSTHTGGAAPYSAIDRDREAVARLVTFLSATLTGKRL